MVLSNLMAQSRVKAGRPAVSLLDQIPIKMLCIPDTLMKGCWSLLDGYFFLSVV